MNQDGAGETATAPDVDAKPPSFDGAVQQQPQQTEIQSFDPSFTKAPDTDAKPPSFDGAVQQQPQQQQKQPQQTGTQNFDRSFTKAGRTLTDSLKMTTQRGFIGYFLINLFGSAVVAVCVTLLWSEIGYGEPSLAKMADAEIGAYVCVGLMGAVAWFLYILDFFWPPHLPGKFCVLVAGGYKMGNFLLGLLIGLLYLAGFMMANYYAWAPALLTTFLCPAWVFFARWLMQPRFQFDAEEGNLGGVKQKHGPDFLHHIRKVVELKEGEGDRDRFYRSVVAALSVVAMLNFAFWLEWHLDHAVFPGNEASTADKEEFFILWSAPLLVTGAYLNLALLSGLFLFFSVGDGKTKKKNKKDSPQAAQVAPMQSRPGSTDSVPAGLSAQHGKAFASLSDGNKEHFAEYHNNAMRQLKIVLKCMVTAVVAMMGLVYVAYVLSSSTLLLMVQAWLVLTLFTAGAFVYITFNGLWRSIWEWFVEMPMLKAIIEMCYTDWGKACALFALFPVLPLILLTSMLNQRVRRWRGLYKRQPFKLNKQLSGRASARRQEALASVNKFMKRIVETDKEEDMLVTPRIHELFLHAIEWNPCDILEKVSLLAIAGVLMSLTAVFLNVLLAWLISVLSDLSLALVVVAVWFIGLCLFLLPPVPGAPIYLFGGVLISGKGATDWGGDSGFWLATALCISVCFVLKLSACTVQQKLIGERLGSKLWVRQTVGVHKPFIRAIEFVLEKRGMSFGKVVILVGGPDWPTSVLAGVLRLSLFQCLLGTVPIIVYITPLTLTGSFFYKRSAGATWRNLGDLMFTLTAVVTILLWVAIWWTIQDVLEKESKRLHRPLAKNVELEWLDYKEAHVNKKCAVHWRKVPILVRMFFVTGCVTIVLVFHLFYWLPDWCFNSFDVTDDINTLHWYGEKKSLILDYGLYGLFAMVGGVLGVIIFEIWRITGTHHLKKAGLIETDAMEKAWKARRLEECEQAAREWEKEGQDGGKKGSDDVVAFDPSRDELSEEEAQAAMPKLQLADAAAGAPPPSQTPPKDGGAAPETPGVLQVSEASAVAETAEAGEKSSGENAPKEIMMIASDSMNTQPTVAKGTKSEDQSGSQADLASQQEVQSANGDGKKKTATKKKKTMTKRAPPGPVEGRGSAPVTGPGRAKAEGRMKGKISVT